MINGHGPIVSGDVPIELVMVGEKADRIRRRVRDLDCLGGVRSARNVNLELTGPARSAALILELVPVVVRDLLNLQKQGVIGTGRPRVFDRNVAVDSVERAVELNRNPLGDGRSSVLSDADGAVKVGDTPIASWGRQSGGQQQTQQKQEA